MKVSRREAAKILLAATVAAPSFGQSAPSVGAQTWDVAVIGAGVFGAWSAYWLRKQGLRVILLDAYGAANSRASSGGESRIIRAAYGADAFYSRWVLKSLPQWTELAMRTGQSIFHRTGVLMFADESTAIVQQSADTLQQLRIPHERLSAAELMKRYPQITFRERDSAIYEPESGALMARRAVQALVAELLHEGVDYRQAAVSLPHAETRMSTVETGAGDRVSAGAFVFACGPWLPKLFPELLGDVIKPERAEVYFLGVPAGDSRFSAPSMPTWIHMSKEWDAYGMPSLENRGFKLAVDKISLPADPDTMDREPTEPYLKHVRAFVSERFPALKNAPVVETRVCQYEYTTSGNYIVDRHPAIENAWIVGGGSGHGFKNGPAVGQYAAGLVAGTTPIEKLLTLERQKHATHRVD
jgi:monomeric sarcosine oxidase